MVGYTRMTTFEQMANTNIPADSSWIRNGCACAQYSDTVYFDTIWVGVNFSSSRKKYFPPGVLPQYKKLHPKQKRYLGDINFGLEENYLIF